MQTAPSAAGTNDEIDPGNLPSGVNSAATSLTLRPAVTPQPLRPRIRRSLSAATESVLIPRDGNNSRLSGASSLRSESSALSEGSGPSAFTDTSTRPSVISAIIDSAARARRAQYSEASQPRLLSDVNNNDRLTGTFTGALQSRGPAPSATTAVRPRAYAAAGEATSAPPLASSQRSASQSIVTSGVPQAVYAGLATGASPAKGVV